MPNANIDEATRELKVSKFYLYRLPVGTPGVQRFGRRVVFDLDKLKAWAERNHPVVYRGKPSS